MIIIKPKYFIYFIFLLLLISLISYIYIYDLTIKSKFMGVYSYKNFLIKNTINMERIIIDSGSNSIYAINSEIIEKEFNKVVINISDNGGYPLKNKLYRIKKYSKVGDIIILPLEYTHYTYHNIPKNYYDNIFGPLSFYYEPLPFIEKIKFALSSPIDSITNSFSKSYSNFDFSMFFVDKFNLGFRGDYEFIKKAKMDSDTLNSSCFDYIFYLNKKYDFNISDTFKENIILIKEIEKSNGVKFFITYPAVVGKNCYNSKIYKDKFYKLKQQIEDYLKKHNIPLIGTEKDSYFDEKYINDTYYHVVPFARDIRTKSLINNIKESKYYKLFIENNSNYNPYLEPKDFINKYKSSIKDINADEEYKINRNTPILLISGWYENEKWGTWSNGKDNKLMFKIKKEYIKNNLSINIKSIIFGDDNTDVYVNNNFIGTYLLQGKNKILVDKKYLTDDIVIIRFLNKNIISPKEKGINEDERLLKLGLESITISYE